MCTTIQGYLERQGLQSLSLLLEEGPLSGSCGLPCLNKLQIHYGICLQTICKLHCSNDLKMCRRMTTISLF